MAIGTPTTIGQATSGSSPINITTTAAVPSGALVVIVACVGSSGASPTLTASGGSLTWATDQTTAGAPGGYNIRVAVCSAPAPSGLASGSTLSVTASGGNDGLLAAACYITGMDTGGTRFDIGAGTSASSTSWNTGTATTTNANDLIIGGCFMDGTRTNTASGGATEIHDFQFAGNAWTLCTEYKIVAATGSQSLTGSITGGNVAHVEAFAAYKGAGGGGGGAVNHFLASQGAGG